MKRGKTPIVSPRVYNLHTPQKLVAVKKIPNPEKNFIRANKSNVSLTKHEAMPLNAKIEKLEKRYAT